MTIKNQFSLIAITALLISFAVIFFTRHKRGDEMVFIYAMPIASDSGWGYKIYRSVSGQKDTTVDKVYIRQDFIPGIPGRKGFATAQDALQVAGLVIQKISANQLPTIYTRELDSMGIRYR
jgi:hypothetical protein